MAIYTVTRVRVEQAEEGGHHEHIVGVCTDNGTFYTRQEVVDSIKTVNTWRTLAAGDYATIRPLRYCTHLGCMASPYIATYADDAAKNNLDNLPRC